MGQLGVGFVNPKIAGPKIAGAVQAKEPFHGTEALFYPEPAFGDQFVEALF